MKHAAENGRMHKILNPPLYIPLQKTHFDTIEINIMCDTGEPVPFAHGKSFAVLEFKRIGLLEKVIQRTVCCNFYSARNARIASAVLATAIPSVRLSVCLSVRHTPALCKHDGT